MLLLMSIPIDNYIFNKIAFRCNDRDSIVSGTVQLHLTIVILARHVSDSVYVFLPIRQNLDSYILLVLKIIGNILRAHLQPK